jgi:hypothetical protein
MPRMKRGMTSDRLMLRLKFAVTTERLQSRKTHSSRLRAD